MTYQTYVGIDVSKAKIDVAWINKTTDKAKTKQFTNDKKGFNVFAKWIKKESKQQAEDTLIIMEATGVYHENLAYALHKTNFNIAVVNPDSKQFSNAMGNHNKTDKQDSIMLAKYAIMTNPQLWQPDSEEVRYLKRLIARLDALEKDKQREQNRLEKLKAIEHDEFLLESLVEMIDNLDTAITKVQKKIDEHINSDPDLKEGYDNLISIPGVGVKLTPRLVSLFKSKTFKSASQCTAFVGLAPVQNESGIFKGRSRISKKGNTKIRANLYMCAMVAIKHNPDIKALYERLLARGKCKMVALIACMRKLLQICFGVMKHKSKFQTQVGLN